MPFLTSPSSSVSVSLDGHPPSCREGDEQRSMVSKAKNRVRWEENVDSIGKTTASHRGIPTDKWNFSFLLGQQSEIGLYLSHKDISRIRGNYKCVKTMEQSACM